MLKEGEAVVELVIENPLRLWANVPERYTRRGQGRPGGPGLPSPRTPARRFEGKVARINPRSTRRAGRSRSRRSSPTTSGLLRPGGFAKASIVTKTDAQAVVVPLESVVQFAGVTKLFVVEDGKARADPRRDRPGRQRLGRGHRRPARARPRSSPPARRSSPTGRRSIVRSRAEDIAEFTQRTRRSPQRSQRTTDCSGHFVSASSAAISASSA